jgi:hypothetical protein
VRSPFSCLREKNEILESSESPQHGLEGHGGVGRLSSSCDRQPEVQLVGELDAVVWAREFMRITGGTADEETMIAWFANSIMSGWDNHYWRSDEYKQMVARVLQPEPEPAT